MSAQPFKSKLWLKLKTDFDEKLYHEFRLNSVQCWIYFLSAVSLLASLMNFGLQLTYIKDGIQKADFPYSNILIMTYICLGLNIIFTFSIIFTSETQFRQYFYYLQFLSMEIAFFSLQFSISVYGLDPNNKYNLHGAEALIKILTFVVFLEFIDSIVLTLISICWSLPVYGYLKNWEMAGFIYTYILFNLSFLLIAYFITYTRKTSFVYSGEYRKKSRYFNSIVEKMKSGFIHVKDNKISYINQNMEDIIKKNSKINKIICDFKEINTRNIKKSDENFFDSDDNSKLILQELLDGLKFEIIDKAKKEPETNTRENFIPNSDIINLDVKKSISQDKQKGENYICIFEKFKNHIGTSKETNFTMVGIKKLPVGDGILKEYLTLEIYFKYYHNVETNKDEFEIMLNEVTNAKVIEKKKSEFKYNFIFLSKVAHELKSPLVIILELVNQLSENFRQIQARNNDVLMKCDDNINQIHSISNYSKILIRDFDYFSQKNILMNKMPFEKQECDLKEIFSFCNNIAISLLQRSRKNILFEIEIKENVPDKIVTDENRLKQVLINLISNAIKFTNEGKVVLKVHREESDVVFCVSDTGVGLDLKNKKNLFSPFNCCEKSSNVNSNGSGLGMSIIHDLTKALGKQVEFKTQLNKGSDFFFSIAVDETEYKNSLSKSLNSFQHFISERNEPSIRSYYPTYLIKENFYSSNSHPLKLEISMNKSVGRKLSEKSLDINIKLKQDEEEISQILNKDLEGTSNSNEINLSSDLFLDEARNVTKIKDFKYPQTKLIVQRNSIISLLDEKVEPQDLDSNYKTMDDANIRTARVMSPKFINENNLNNSQEMIELVQPKSKETLQNLLKKENKKKAHLISKKSGILSEHIHQFIIQFTSEEAKQCINILLVDDEKFSRSSNKRLISNFAKNNNNIKVNFIEAEDGFECLYILYACIKKGVKISCVVSDQSMTYMNGSTSATVFKQMANNKTLIQIPFYIVTAHEDESTATKIKSAPITNVFTKPLNKMAIEKIFEEIK